MGDEARQLSRELSHAKRPRTLQDIEEAIREEEQFIDKVDDGVFDFDDEQSMLEFNDTTNKLHGSGDAAFVDHSQWLEDAMEASEPEDALETARYWSVQRIKELNRVQRKLAKALKDVPPEHQEREAWKYVARQRKRMQQRKERLLDELLEDRRDNFSTFDKYKDWDPGDEGYGLGV
jgi:hypothetical protein